MVSKREREGKKKKRKEKKTTNTNANSTVKSPANTRCCKNQKQAGGYEKRRKEMKYPTPP
jgi:hypothetical protein